MKSNGWPKTDARKGERECRINEDCDNDNIVEQHRCDQCAAILAAQPAGDADGKQRRATYARDRHRGGRIERSV
ncbi:MAG TPA: hypothetical protein VK678_13350, partial [Bradyrhizobium sp.]|nr:hypothetical protein [Bradyrhizobium sp.]